MNLFKQITAFLKKTPIKSSDLQALTELAEKESWLVSLNTYIRLHDKPLRIMTEFQIRGAELEDCKAKILEHLEKVWL